MSQYNDGMKQIPAIYAQSNNENNYNCPAQCSCDLGTRTAYDVMQYQKFVLNENVQFPKISNNTTWNKK